MDALDRALSAALDVNPSPEFVARVRERIANEPSPAPLFIGRMPRMLLAAGALAGVIGVSMVVTSRPTNPDVASALRRTVAMQPLSGENVRLKPDATPDATPDGTPDATKAFARHRRPRAVDVIQLVSIDGMPTAPIGDVVPAMRFDGLAMTPTFEVVTMTGVHP